MHAAHGRREDVHPCFFDKLSCLFRSPKSLLRRIRHDFVNFRATAYVADLSFHQHGRMDCLERGHSLFRLADILFDWQRREIEDNKVESHSRNLFSAGKGMGMVRIKKDREVILIAQAPYQGCDLRGSHEGPFTLRCANNYWRVQFLRGAEDSFQKNEVRNIKMANRGAALLRLL